MPIELTAAPSTFKIKMKILNDFGAYAVGFNPAEGATS
jgi:hypothetical protein